MGDEAPRRKVALGEVEVPTVEVDMQCWGVPIEDGRGMDEAGEL